MLVGPSEKDFAAIYDALRNANAMKEALSYIQEQRLSITFNEVYFVFVVPARRDIIVVENGNTHSVNSS